jgi:hypothetical protein
MNVIRHHDEGMQLVAAESLLAIADGTGHNGSDFWNCKMSWTNFGFVEDSVHGDECFSAS